MENRHSGWSNKVEPLMTEREFARAVGLAEVTVRKKRTHGELPHYRFNRAVRYGREHLEAYLAQAFRPAAPKDKTL